MSTERTLLFRALPSPAPDLPDPADAPEGVPAHAEALAADGPEGSGLIGWRWEHEHTAPEVTAPPHWSAARLPAAVVQAPTLLVVSDVDATLIRDEVISLLAAHAGRGEEVAAVTERAMRGELDFAESLHARVEALAGLPVSVVDDVAGRVTPTHGAEELVAAVAAAGGRVCAVSGGFTQVLDQLAARLGLHGSAANVLEVQDGTLTGRVLGDVVDRAAKADWLRRWAEEAGLEPGQAVGVGDGANDLDLLAAAGVGVGLCAKPALWEQADVRVDVPSLTPLRWLLGL
ncbi:phosphoserine phosphatase SerB [Micrococcus sp.]|uniref:phosphoserine phosphatase SerB n=1 Tax=Micrococcus sp. TaxID=1271 RepID=UPI002A90DFCF|nr:phosphoserine phosphatase SerB [Micrococcus sp.]MDY6054280.1 phosphoserine phosphatase SerB [Micrococcus sp.]